MGLLHRIAQYQEDDRYIGNMQESFKTYSRALEIDPRLGNANYNVAQLLEKKGNMPGAIEAYQKELEYSPKHFKASFNLSRLYRKSGQEEEEFK